MIYPLNEPPSIPIHQYPTYEYNIRMIPPLQNSELQTTLCEPKAQSHWTCADPAGKMLHDGYYSQHPKCSIDHDDARTSWIMFLPTATPSSCLWPLRTQCPTPPWDSLQLWGSQKPESIYQIRQFLSSINHHYKWVMKHDELTMTPLLTSRSANLPTNLTMMMNWSLSLTITN